MRDGAASEQAALVRGGDGLGAPADAELSEGAGEQCLDRLVPDAESGRDLAVRCARGHQSEHLALSRAQRRVTGRPLRMPPVEAAPPPATVRSVLTNSSLLPVFSTVACAPAARAASLNPQCAFAVMSTAGGRRPRAAASGRGRYRSRPAADGRREEGWDAGARRARAPLRRSTPRPRAGAPSPAARA